MPQSSTASPKLPPGISAEQAQMESERMQDVVLLVEGLLRQEEATLGMIVECLYDIGSVRLIDKKLHSWPLNTISKSIAGFSKPVVRVVALRWLKKNCPELLANWLYSKVQFNEEPPRPAPKVDDSPPPSPKAMAQTAVSQPPVMQQDKAAQTTPQTTPQTTSQPIEGSAPTGTPVQPTISDVAPILKPNSQEPSAAPELTIRLVPAEVGANGTSVLSGNQSGSDLEIAPSQTPSDATVSSSEGMLLQPLPLVIPASDTPVLNMPVLDMPVLDMPVSDMPVSETGAEALPLALAVEQIAIEQAGAEQTLEQTADLTLPQRGNGAIAPPLFSQSASLAATPSDPSNGQGLKLRVGGEISDEGLGGALVSLPDATLATGSLKDSERAIAQLQYRDSEIQRLRAHNRILFGVVVASAIALGAALLVPNCAIDAGGAGESATVQTAE